MCPACIVSVTWLVIGAASTGGLAALVAGRFRPKDETNPPREGKQ